MLRSLLKKPGLICLELKVRSLTNKRNLISWKTTILIVSELRIWQTLMKSNQVLMYKQMYWFKMPETWRMKLWKSKSKLLMLMVFKIMLKSWSLLWEKSKRKKRFLILIKMHLVSKQRLNLIIINEFLNFKRRLINSIAISKLLNNKELLMLLKWSNFKKSYLTKMLLWNKSRNSWKSQNFSLTNTSSLLKTMTLFFSSLN